MKEIDQDAARELFLFAYSDGKLYQQRILPIIKNLQKKVAKGTYDKELAVKAFQYAADDAAKRYDKEFSGTHSSNMGGTFSVATRKETARQLLEHYTEHIFEKDDIDFGTRNKPFPLNIQ